MRGVGGEVINTAVEKMADLLSSECRPQAGLKDIVTRGVLIYALIALIIALLIFLPYSSIFFKFNS